MWLARISRFQSLLTFSNCAFSVEQPVQSPIAEVTAKTCRANFRSIQNPFEDASVCSEPHSRLPLVHTGQKTESFNKSYLFWKGLFVGRAGLFGADGPVRFGLWATREARRRNPGRMERGAPSRAERRGGDLRARWGGVRKGNRALAGNLNRLRYGLLGEAGFVFRAGVVLPGFCTATVTSAVEVFPAASAQATVMV